MKQWEIYDYPFLREQPHPVVILTPDERLRLPQLDRLNGLICVTLRGGRELKPYEVRLNSADGFDWATACRCDFMYALEPALLGQRRGQVSVARRTAIARKLREFFHLNIH